MDWRDLRVALAVERHRTLSAAGLALGMDATTVSRRISALEEQLGTTLFRRGAEGWSTTPAGGVVVARAARMAEEVRALRHDVDQATARVEGNVRITLLDEVASWFVAPHLRALRALHPGLDVELVCTEKVLDLARGRADIAVRLQRPTEGGMRVRRLGTIQMGLYAASSYLRAFPGLSVPSAAEVDLCSLGTRERPVMEVRWALSLLPNARIAAVTNSVSALQAMVESGVGLGVLALPPAEAAGLCRLDVGIPGVERPLWRVVPEAIADAPRIRAVLAWLDELPAG